MSDRAPTLRTALVVASREVSEHARTPLVWVLVIAAVSLAILATEVGVRRAATVSQRFTQMEEERAADVTRNVALTGARVEPSLRVLRTPQPLAMLVEGQELGRPQYWDFGPAGVRSGPALVVDSAYTPTTQPFDVETVIRIVIGLLAVLLAVESVAGERVKGTLLVLLGQPVSPGAVSAGKILGATATLALTIACCALGAIVTIVSRAPQQPGAGLYLSLLAICTAGLTYAVICLSIGMLISTLLTSYRLALTITFAVWSLSALMAPQATLAIGRLAAPVPPYSIVEADRDRLAQRLTETTQRRMGDEYAASLGGPAAWPAKQADAAATRAAEKNLEPIWSVHISSLRRELDTRRTAFDLTEQRQRRLIRRLLLANPVAAFTSAAGDLAGVGDGMAVRWRSAVRAREAVVNEQLFDNRPLTMALVPYVSSRAPDTERRLVVEFRSGPPRTPSDLPAFRLPDQSLRHRLADAASALLVLTGYAAVSVALCVLGFTTREFDLSWVE